MRPEAYLKEKTITCSFHMVVGPGTMIIREFVNSFDRDDDLAVAIEGGGSSRSSFC